MCSKEINFYKKISKKKSIKWIPLSSPLENLKSDNLKLSDALLHLHAKDSSGKFHIGVDAFILIWSQLPFFKYLRFFFLMPFIHQASRFFYNKFAEKRFNNLSHCKLSLEKGKSSK
jgi:predicted DCC family thiol-disulfide oxidoreductase YuxK